MRMLSLVAHYITRAPLGSGESHILLGGGGLSAPPLRTPKLLDRFPKFKRHSIRVRELSKHGVKFDLEVTNDVTDQAKVSMFDFSGFLTSASTISLLNAHKTNESAWIVSLTFVSIISCVLWPYNTNQGHLSSPGKKGQAKKSGFRAAMHVFGSDFRKEREKWPQTFVICNTFIIYTHLWFVTHSIVTPTQHLRNTYTTPRP